MSEKEVREISRKGNRREVVEIVTDKGKRISTTHHERLVNGKWQREARTPVIDEPLYDLVQGGDEK